MTGKLFVLSTVAVFLASAQNPRQKDTLAKTLYKQWLNEDLVYIITGEERQEFQRLQSDEARDRFVEEFWLRRDPTPDTRENEYKDEHYRRIAYANIHFSTGLAGWKTDRGGIYIGFGPPDEIESRSGESSKHPIERWTYRYIEGIGNNVVIEFVDILKSGEYQLKMDPSEKDLLLHISGTLNDQLGLLTNPTTFTRTDPPSAITSEFERLARFAKSSAARWNRLAYRELEAVASSKIRHNTLPMKVRTDFIKLTGCTVLTNVTLQFDSSTALINIFARVASASRRPIIVFEGPAIFSQTIDGASIYQKSIPLAPGLYRLNVVAKDLADGNLTSYEMALNVPQFAEDQLASSSLILADAIEKAPERGIGTGQFVIGDTKVRPRVNQKFARNENLGVYAQLYDFGVDTATGKPRATIEYQIAKAGTDRPALAYSEEIAAIPVSSARQVTVEKLLPLASLEPGQYSLTLRVIDKKRNQTLTRAVGFTVE